MGERIFDFLKMLISSQGSAFLKSTAAHAISKNDHAVLRYGVLNDSVKLSPYNEVRRFHVSCNYFLLFFYFFFTLKQDKCEMGETTGLR